MVLYSKLTQYWHVTEFWKGWSQYQSFILCKSPEGGIFSFVAALSFWSWNFVPAAPPERTDQDILRFVRYYFVVYCSQSII
jgi:hypothetical protein